MRGFAAAYVLLLLTLPANAAEEAVKPDAPAVAEPVASANAPDEPERPAPFMLIRALQDLQNKIVLGDASAQTGQGKLVAEIGAELLRTSPEAWKDIRNVRALAVYLFTGGTPGPVRRILAAGVIPDESDSLIRGALAYAEGRPTEARALLSPLDPFSVPASFGGYLALTQGALLARDEPAQALAALDVARLLAPGTVVEETALRRSAFVAAQMGNLSQFGSFGNRYLRLYPKSVYGRDFRERLPAAIASFPPQVLQTEFMHVVALIDELNPDQRRSTYLAVARVAAMKGKGEVSSSASELAAKNSAPGSPDRARADLYRSAGTLTGPQGEAAPGLLAKIDGADLSPEDRELLAAARFVSEQLYPSFAGDVWLPEDQRPADTESMKVAARALAESNRLIQGMTK